MSPTNTQKTIYTPSKPVTYGQWQGLFYITTNFKDEASYIIGEGLNGGYSVCGLPGMGGLCEWAENWVDFLRKDNIVTSATIISPTNNQTYTVGDTINFEVQYKYTVNGTTFYQKTERRTIETDNLGPGTQTLTTSYGTQVKVDFILKPNPELDSRNINIPEPREPEFLEGFIDEIATEWGVEITSFLAGVGISEGIRLLTPVIAKKVTVTVAGKMVARFIPVVGWALVLGSVGSIAYKSGPLALKCGKIFSDSMDDKLLELRSHWYFCGKITADSLFVAAGVAADKLVGERLINYVVSRKMAIRIATGHALTSHLSEFADLGITTEKELIEYVMKIINKPDLSKSLLNNRRAYYNIRDNAIVIYDPANADLGTAFRPIPGIDYYNNLE